MLAVERYFPFEIRLPCFIKSMKVDGYTAFSRQAMDRKSRKGGFNPYAIGREVSRLRPGRLDVSTQAFQLSYFKIHHHQNTLLLLFLF